jgi:hypothetical protein
MAKRRLERKNQQEETWLKRRALLYKAIWGVVLFISLLFGVSHGYPLVAEGEVAQGVLTGLVYGGGAFAALVVSLYVNRKLRGL